MKADLVLIHAPSLYDFREKDVHHGPISDLIPSTPVFELYPVGFLTLLTYLGKKGYKVRILNIATQMLMDASFDVEKEIKKIDAAVYGIDLHWMVHVQGAVEVAKIIKKIWDRPVVFGGFTSTIFWKDILQNYKQVDYVLSGDTTEEPFKKLLEYLIEGRGVIEDIPNLSWREGELIKTNGITFVPEDIGGYSIDYSFVAKEAIKSMKPKAFLPFAKFMQDPIGMSLAYKGCDFNCITCGGSCHTFKNSFQRTGIAFKPAEKVAEEILSINQYMKIPVFLVGDLQFNLKHAAAIIKELKENKFDAPIFFEFFKPPNRETLTILEQASDEVILHISPESHSEKVRNAFGRPYQNSELEKFISHVAELNFKRVDLYFMTGLPFQTYTSAVETHKYIESITKKIPESKKILDCFISPLAPFVDPGSIVFKNPDKFGYKLRFNDLESHRLAIENATNWKNALNYETVWMNRDEIAASSYEASKKLIKLKIANGIVDEEKGEQTIQLINVAKEIIEENDKITKPITIRETVPEGDLYPSKNLLLTLKPKFFTTLIRTILRL
ncbi:MAG: B12 binding domain protein [Candidatus Argoarchaeum ethanivorans]|uniref:B12 binding domain protein n=1 Tax=Candidatus Argoarchaeum ethanivorans TaxID=2608793 RepID=A0A811TFU4_9EURY|nr:MAG: B12 binding domain protein [Candidatus Argoarchaeum ethanivorans]